MQEHNKMEMENRRGWSEVVLDDWLSKSKVSGLDEAMEKGREGLAAAHSLDLDRVPVIGYYTLRQFDEPGYEATETSLKSVLKHIQQGMVVHLRSGSEAENRDHIHHEFLAAFVLGLFRKAHPAPVYCYECPGMIFELDEIEESEFQRTFRKICSIPEVYAAFRNPSGKGITVILLFERTLEGVWPPEGVGFPFGNLLPKAYLHVYKYYAKRIFGIDTVDEKTCGVGQFCHVTDDRDLFLNPRPQLLNPEKDAQAIDEYFNNPSQDSVSEFYAACSRARDIKAKEKKLEEKWRRQHPELLATEEADLPF